MDLEALRAFVRVAELASFTRAADHLNLTKAQTSLRVAGLEAELGVRLFQRTTRTVTITADGAQLLPKAAQLVADADELAALFQGSRALRGVVRLDLPIVFARDHIIPRLPELLAAHPQLELQISTTDRRVDVVREGFDLVMSVGTLLPSNLTAVRVGELPVASCASPAYLNRTGLPLSIDDLLRQKHQMIHYAMRFGHDAPTFEYRTPRGGYATVALPAAITVNSADAYRVACLAGLGIIQAPRVGVADALTRGDLVELLPESPAEPMPVSLVHPHGRALPKRVRAVMTWLAAVIRARLA